LLFPRGWLRRADDPGFWVRAGQVCRLYLNPPPGTVLISLDEKTAMQARSRKHPGIPLQPGLDIHLIMDNGSSHTSPRHPSPNHRPPSPKPH